MGVVCSIEKSGCKYCTCKKGIIFPLNSTLWSEDKFNTWRSELYIKGYII